MKDSECGYAEVIESVNPATLDVNAEIRATSPAEIPDIAEYARAAFLKWSAVPFKKRLGYLHRLNDYVLKNMDDICRTITLDNGKTMLEALSTELYPVLDMLNFISSDGRKAFSKERLRNPMFSLARIESENVFAPVGVVGIISPWNFPFAIPMTQILPAIALGNTVIFKPSEFTPLVGDRIRRMFESVDLPSGVVSVIQGQGDRLGDPMLETGKLNRVVFTGSIPVGKHLMKKAAETLTPITLELGGKDPFIVLDDADIERASSAAVWGAYANAGQVCASVERVYVHEGIADEFIGKVVEKTLKVRVGNGLDPDVDMGPMIAGKRIDTVEAHIADAVKKGAVILTGGKRISKLPGYFFEPTVLVNVDHSMDAMREETFGPTLPIMTFKTTDEAVHLANDSRYGLLSSVWSRNVKKARQIAARIEAGTVIINDCLITYGFAQAPWGGVKESGIGVTHSLHGLREFLKIKNITSERSLLNHDPWWYPYGRGKYEGMKSAFQTMYCDGLPCKAGGILEAVKSLRRAGGK